MLNLITSVKTRFSNRVTSIASRDLDMDVPFAGALFNRSAKPSWEFQPFPSDTSLLRLGVGRDTEASVSWFAL